ncbi:MAG: HEAT repeat domain-containing protein [Candidatus Methylomirabilia bacterium]
MRGVPQLARVFAAAALLATTGCVRWTHLAPSELQIHGKAGQVCSAAATPLVWSVNTALFPVSVASLGRKPPSHDNLGYPGLAVENAAYLACATLGFPLHALGRGTERVFFLLADRESVEDHLIERLPDLSPGDYARLVRTAERTSPPRYERQTESSPQSVQRDESPREYGLWSTGQTPRFGSKPRLGNTLAAAEWRDWRAAGRPRGAGDETTFTVNRALGFSDPAFQFAATYGRAHQSSFEKELASQLATAAALAGAGTQAAGTAARRDPSPIVRAAAANLLARSRDEAATGELTGLLEDQAVMVRAAAADGLASRADPESVAALGGALSDTDPFVRERAALALGRVGSAAAAARLLPALGNIGHRARFEALCALAETATSGARGALSEALVDPDLHTRIAAAAAVGRTAADPDDPLFLRASRDPDPRISETAAQAREQRGAPCSLR